MCSYNTCLIVYLDEGLTGFQTRQNYLTAPPYFPLTDRRGFRRQKSWRVSLETYQKWAFSETRFLLGFSDLRFSEDASRSRNGSSRSRKGRAISDARPSAQKGTHAMERESRPSDSDHTMRSVLSPLRPPSPTWEIRLPKSISPTSSRNTTTIKTL